MSSAAAIAGTTVPVRRRTSWYTFWSLIARDTRVARRELPSFLARTVTQPVLFIFVFSFVLPKIGAGAALVASHRLSFGTILAPGLIGSAILVQGFLGVTTPLMMELSYTREIEDRMMAPTPIWVVAAAKVTFGAAQTTIAAILVVPCVLLVHARGQSAAIDLSRWPQALALIVLTSLLMACLGLLVGTLVNPQRLGPIFAVLLTPVLMLGCVYYPWAQLGAVRWLQVLVLLNPLVYVNEALRAVLSPMLPHMPILIYLPVLLLGTCASAIWAAAAFTRRLID